MARKKKSSRKKDSIQKKTTLPNKQHQAIEKLLRTGIAMQNSADYQGAIDQYLKVLEINPTHADAIHLIGLVAYQTKQYEKAIEVINSAISINDQVHSFYFNLGNAHLKLKNLPEAIAAFKKSIELKPDYDLAYGNLASTYLLDEQYENALEYAIEAIKMNPDSKESGVYYTTAANVLLILGNLKAAEEFSVRGLQCDPNRAELYKVFGDILSKQGKFEAAREALGLSLKLDHENLDTKGNYAFSLLGSGHLKDGWEFYKAGYEQGYRTPPDFNFKHWNGEDLTNKSIMILPEQGLGDELLFASCIPDLMNLTKNIYINCDERLGDIFERSFENSKIVRGRGAAYLDKVKDTVPKLDYQVSCADLPGFFRNSITDFPETTGYLKADRKKTKYWKKRVSELGEGLNVGISWRSGILNIHRAYSYVNLEDWEPILRVKGVNFINLQYDDCQDIIDNVNEKFAINIHNFRDIDLKNDLDSTIALIDSLDLVISISNAVAMLSSSIGKTTWKLSAPSWLMLGTDHEPWFPNTKIYVKEDTADWTPVIDNISQDLISRTTE